jgi:DNA gyrase subunit A
VREGDMLLEAALTNGTNEVMIATKAGKVVRFNESKVRPMGRNASGVKAVNLDEEEVKGNEVIGMICINDMSANVLVVSEKGYGKRSEIDEYRVTNRGGKGVKTINVTDKTGQLIAIKSVTDENDLMIINKSGITIRIDVANLRVMGRATQGVRLINVADTDEIAAVSKVVKDDEEAIFVEGENNDATIVSDTTDVIGETDADTDTTEANDTNEPNPEA